MKEIIKNVLRESSDNNLEQLSQLSSFKKRIEYMNNNNNKLGAGSSRIVYDYNDKIVIKLAKNAKGIAQNKKELEFSNDYYFKHILAQTYGYDSNYKYIQMEKAQPLTKAKFNEIMRYTFDDYCEYIQMLQNGHSMGISKKEYIEQVMEEDGDYFPHTIVEFARSNGLKNTIGDYCRTSSYGIVKRDGYDAVVLIDRGLDKTVLDKYYS